MESKQKVMQEKNFTRNGEMKKINFDHFRCYEGGMADNIIINLPNADINVHQEISSKIKINISGAVKLIDDDVRCRAERKNRNVVITLLTKGKIVEASFKVDIYLPIKDFKLLSIISSSNICIGEGVYAKTLRVRTTSGMIKSNLTFENAVLESVDGDIDVSFFAESDVKASIFSESGDINLRLANIRKAHIDTHTAGAVRNYFRESRGYNALIDISSISGDIFIE